MKKDFKAIRKNLRMNIIEFLYGRRLSFPPELKNAYKISEAITNIEQRWQLPSKEDNQIPIFIFSAGWRSGSTLLQRLVFSSGEITIWGEPLGDAAFVARLAHCLGFITINWPPETFFMRNAMNTDIANQWIANLAPPISYLKKAHKAFFLQWFQIPAQEQFNTSRWGIKEVRLTIDHARYLKWLFPDARFLFIFRNPYDAFRSWKGNRWRSPWPGYYPYSALAFARHWDLLLQGYIAGCKDVDGMLVKFEDLISGKLNLNKIANHIKVKSIDSSVLNKKIASPAKTTSKPPISLLDKIIITAICRSLMLQVGYL